MINKKQLEEDLSEAVVAELTKKGLKMDTKNPDCIFTYTLKMNRKYAVNQQQEVVYSPNYYPGFMVTPALLCSAAITGPRFIMEK